MGDDVAGNEPKAKAIRDKVATSCRAAGVEILCGEGAALEIELITPGIEHRLAEKSGSWFTFGGTRVGQGRADCRIFLKDTPGIVKELRERVRRWHRRVIARCAGPCARWPRASARCRS